MGTRSDPCVLDRDHYPACSLLTPEQVQQLSVPAYKKRKDKKKDKTDKSEEGDKLVVPSTAMAIGPTGTDNMNTTGVFPVKDVSKTTDHSSSSEFRTNCLPASLDLKLS